MSSSWFREEPALIEALHEQAQAWPDEQRAWDASGEEDLLVGIAARHCTTAETREALLDTVVAVVESTLRPLPVSGADKLDALQRDGDEARLTVFTGEAFGRACAAVLEARRLLAALEKLAARGMEQRAMSAWPRAVTSMVQALRAAQGAFGHFTERQGGVRGRTTTPAPLVRQRHPRPRT